MKISDKIAQQNAPFYSLEFFPPKEREQWPSFFGTVERLKGMSPLFASVTYGAGGSTQENTLGVTSHLQKEMGIEPMAHLTCVGATRDHVAAFLESLREAGIHNVLALRGDAPAGQTYDWSKGEFHYASDLVSFVRTNFPDFCISVAGYPAGHPESVTFADDIYYARRKIEAGADFVVTQLFFDVREYLDFVGKLRALGVNKPVLPGILPIQSFESVRRILSLCGANIPGKLYLALEEAHEKGGAEAVREAGIAFAVQQIRTLLDAGAPGIHLYTLNRAEMCLRIRDEVGSLS